MCEVLDYLQNCLDFLDPKAIENPEYTSKQTFRTQIILTFDDSFWCHKEIADECLYSSNIKALFLVLLVLSAWQGEILSSLHKKIFSK